MKHINKFTLEIAGRKVLFPREVSETIDFDNVYVVQTQARKGETNEDWFKIDSIFGISKKSGEIIWSKPGFGIAKKKKEQKIILLKNIKKTDEYELVIYAISMNFYVDPNSGKIIRSEQTK